MENIHLNRMLHSCDFCVDFSLSDFNVSLMSSGTGINRDEQLQHTVVVSYHDVP